MRDNSQATKEINHNNIQLIQKECREKKGRKQRIDGKNKKYSKKINN